MSRWSRDDDRGNPSSSQPDRESGARSQERIQDHVDDLPVNGLTLPRGDEREAVGLPDRQYTLNGSDTRALATVGAFRVLLSEDFTERGQRQHTSNSAWRHLSEQGLVTRETLADRDGARHVMALTSEGKALLDTHREPRRDGRQQEYLRGCREAARACSRCAAVPGLSGGSRAHRTRGRAFDAGSPGLRAEARLPEISQPEEQA